jgi:hypothetical protein
MNRQEGGWRSALFPVESEETLLGEYNVRLGEWTKDECSEYCPVHVLSSEEATLPEVKRPVVIVDGSNVLVGFSIFDVVSSYRPEVTK